MAITYRRNSQIKKFLKHMLIQRLELSPSEELDEKYLIADRLKNRGINIQGLKININWLSIKLCFHMK